MKIKVRIGADELYPYYYLSKASYVVKREVDDIIWKEYLAAKEIYDKAWKKLHDEIGK